MKNVKLFRGSDSASVNAQIDTWVRTEKVEVLSAMGNLNSHGYLLITIMYQPIETPDFLQ